MRYPARLLLPILAVVLTTASCDCENRIRRIISNPGHRKSKVEEAKERRRESESSAPHEEEPNDFPKQATLVELGGDLRPVEAEIAKSDDEDWYALTSRNQEAWQVEATVTPTDDKLDPVIRVAVAGSEDAPTKYDLAGPGQPETIPILAVSSAPQRIVVSSKDGTTGAYEISFQKRLSGGTVEAEPNDDIDAATRFEAPGEIEGFYDRPGDRDIFFVPRKKLAGDVFNLEVSPVDGVVQQVRVYTHRALETPYLSFQVPPAKAAGLPNVRLPDDLLGVWLVLTPGEGYSREHSYRVKLLPHAPVQQTLEAEPNDSADTAQKIALGDELTGYFHAAADVDHFALNVDGVPAEDEAGGAVDAGAPVEPSADAGTEQANAGQSDASQPDAGQPDAGPAPAPNPLDALPEKTAPEHVVRVTAAPTHDEERIGLAWSNPPGGGQPEVIESQEPGEPVTLCNRVVDDGFLALEVRPVDPPQEGMQAELDYTLSTRDVREQDAMEIEPNDTREAADKLTADHARVGYIAKAGDTDVYAFAVPYPERLPATDHAPVPAAQGGSPQDNSPGAQPSFAAPVSPRKVRLKLGANPLNLGFKLLDDEGGMVAEVNRAGAGGEERLQIDLPPGLYFVHVAAKRGASCKPYQLSVDVASQP